jgi:hypothetical protein
VEQSIMNADEVRKQAEQLFKPGAAEKSASPDYEARSRDIRQKINRLRSLRLAAQAQRKSSGRPSE